MSATIDPTTTERSVPVGLRGMGRVDDKPREWWIHWILRIAVGARSRCTSRADRFAAGHDPRVGDREDTVHQWGEPTKLKHQ